MQREKDLKRYLTLKKIPRETLVLIIVAAAKLGGSLLAKSNPVVRAANLFLAPALSTLLKRALEDAEKDELGIETETETEMGTETQTNCDNVIEDARVKTPRKKVT